jgi:hypothetical protein
MEDESSGGWRLAAAGGGGVGGGGGGGGGAVWRERGLDRGVRVARFRSRMVEQCDGGGGDDDEGRRDGETGRRGDGGIVVPLVGSGGTSPTSSAGRWGNGTGANGRASPLYVVSASFRLDPWRGGGRSPLSLPGRRDGCAPEEGNIMTAVLAYRRRKATRAGLHVPTPRCR